MSLLLEINTNFYENHPIKEKKPPPHPNRHASMISTTVFVKKSMHIAAFFIPLITSCPHLSISHTNRPLTAPCKPRRPCLNPPCASLNRQILSLAIPALGALALDPLLSLIDTAFVGRLGVTSLAGTGIATTILNTSFSIFYFLSISTTPLVATAIYKSKTDTSRVTANGILLAAVMGFISATAILILANPLCSALGSSPVALPAAVTYLRLRVIAAPFALASFVTNGALRAHKDLRTAFRVALFANAANVVLDSILIFPLHLGVAGAALATSISQIFAFCLMTSSLLYHDRLRLIHLFRLPDFSELIPLLSAGALLSIRTISLLATIAYATSIAAARGVIDLAAYELCRQLWIFKATLLNSLTTAAQALVASAMASSAFQQAREIADHTLRLATGFGFVLGMSAIAAGNALPRLFTSSPLVYVRAAECIRVAAICAPLNGAVFALDGILTACQDYQYMAGAIALASFFGCLAITIVKVYGGGAVAVWFGMNMLMVARAVVLFWRYMGNNCPMNIEKEK